MKRPLTVAAGALLAACLSAQQDWPAGVTRETLPDGVLRFNRTTTAQPAYWWQQLLETFSWKPAKGLPFRRSIALLTGVSRYESLRPRELAFVETDVTELRNFLLTVGAFDTVLEARNAVVTRSIIER
jgi:hypothetical protein